MGQELNEYSTIILYDLRFMDLVFPSFDLFNIRKFPWTSHDLISRLPFLKYPDTFLWMCKRSAASHLRHEIELRLIYYY